ncbi:MAG: glycosyltransferase family 2 protein [Actinobacteria bacterium]|nr:glycosyltransferase family 2 protein [Actinomycetota bacterium]
MSLKQTDMLEDHVIELINKLKRVDIVIGIPSYNNSATIGKVVFSFSEGLKKYFPDLKSIIINSDGGSKDNTRNIVESVKPSKNIGIISTKYNGPSGKGSAFRTIFEIAKRTEAKVIVVSDSDTKSITPEWCYALVTPVLNLGYGYVTPYYTRDKHDATITNALVYPITRALYGLRLRQPIGGDFSFSNGALQIFLQQK